MNPKTLLQTLKEASPFDLLLISILFLPFVVIPWLELLSTLGIEPTGYGYTLGLGFIIIIYITGIVIMQQGSRRAKKQATAKDQIVQYLTSKDFEMMSYDRVRENIDKGYTDEFIESLLKHFPNDLRKAKLKERKPGIARILAEIIESDADDEA